MSAALRAQSLPQSPGPAGRELAEVCSLVLHSQTCPAPNRVSGFFCCLRGRLVTPPPIHPSPHRHAPRRMSCCHQHRNLQLHYIPTPTQYTCSCTLLRSAPACHCLLFVVLLIPNTQQRLTPPKSIRTSNCTCTLSRSAHVCYCLPFALLLLPLFLTRYGG